MEYFKYNFVDSKECADPISTKVIGEVPSWISGSFLRVGPGKFDLGEDFTLNHWMDGMSIVFKFAIDGGKITFRSKYLRSDAYKKACVAHRPIFTEFGTHSYPDPTKNIFSRMISNFDAHAMTDNATNNIMCIHDQLFVGSETCYVRRIDSGNLDTKEKIDLNKYANLNFATSHALTDSTGTTYNLGGTFMGNPKYHVIKIPPQEEKGKHGNEPFMHTKIHSTIPSSWRASFGYYHSFGMSENYIVFLEQAMTVNTLKLATSQVKSKSMHECMEWHPEEKVKFIVINKSTGEQMEVRYVCDEPFFVFHHANTYEKEGNLVVDVIAYPNVDMFGKLYLDKLRNGQYSDENPPKLTRFVLPLVHDMKSVPEGQELVNFPGTTASAVKVKDSADGYIKVSGMHIGEPGWDMPTVNPAYKGQSYRYIYGTGGWEKGFFKNSALKMDVETGRTWVYRGQEYQYMSEPIYIAAPDAIDEDDGILMVTVIDSRPTGTDCLVFLDPRTMEEIARAEVSGENRVPLGLHGMFLPNKV